MMAVLLALLGEPKSTEYLPTGIYSREIGNNQDCNSQLEERFRQMLAMLKARI